MDRATAGKVGKETEGIIQKGSYVSPSNRRVKLEELLQQTVKGTRLWPPDELDLLSFRIVAELDRSGPHTRFQVTKETTLAACRRLLAEEAGPVGCLNFASAKNAGGGFRSGARAQEETLARASGLYASLTSRAAAVYYAENRKTRDGVYTDHLIWSPDVPIFREESDGRLLEAGEIWKVHMITIPAVNAGVVRVKREKGSSSVEEADVRRTMRRRAEYVLSVAAEQRLASLVLGAWGCGAFGNQPEMVSECFGELLLGAEAKFHNVFRRVVFAVYIGRTGEERNFSAFDRIFINPCQCPCCCAE